MKTSEQQIRKMITHEMVEAANAVCMAKAFVQTVRPIVEGYQKEILARHQFPNNGDLEMHEKHGQMDQFVFKVILDPSESFLLSDADFNTYDNECQEAAKKSGLKVEREGNCPLLEAESILVKANGVFVDLIQPVTKISRETALCSGMEKYQKLVDLGIGLVASLGLLKNNLKAA